MPSQIARPFLESCQSIWADYAYYSNTSGRRSAANKDLSRNGNFTFLIVHKVQAKIPSAEKFWTPSRQRTFAEPPLNTLR